MNRNTIIVIGLIILAVLAYNWTQELSTISVGYYREPSTFSSGMWHGNSPEIAAEKRAVINQKYGIWFVLALGGTVGLAAFAGTSGKSNSTEKAERGYTGIELAPPLLDDNNKGHKKEKEPLDRYTPTSASDSRTRERNRQLEKEQIKSELEKLQERLARLEKDS